MLKSNFSKVNRQGSLCFITFPAFSAQEGLVHAFTTRHGGVSTGYHGEMNLSFNTGDSRENVVRNYEIMCGALGIDPSNLVISRQTHTNNVRVVTDADRGKGIYLPCDYNDVDALVTNCTDVALVTHSADCCLIAFYDPKKRVIGAAHAGWRGTAAEIAGETVKVMVESFGCKPSDIIAAMAPSVGPCCYEVDLPVYNEFPKIHYMDLTKVFSDKGNGKFMLDLWEANRQILCHNGLLNNNITVSDLCTNCLHDDFHSHRYTAGKRGVNGLIIQLTR